MSDISVIHLNNTDYLLKDAYARQMISALGNVMNLKGSKTSEHDIKSIANPHVGDVWLNSADGSEWVCVVAASAPSTLGTWEKLGFTINISGKADKETTPASSGKLAKIDASGNSVSTGVTITTTLGSTDGTVPTSKAVATAISSCGNMSASVYDPDGDVATAGGIVEYVDDELDGLGQLAHKDVISTSTTTVNSITSVGTLPSHAADTFTQGSFTQGTFSAGTLPSHAADSFTAGSYSQGTFRAGTLPSHGADTFTQGSFSQGSFNKGTLPSWSATVTSETLTFSFSAGTLPSHSADSFTKPTFTSGTFSAGSLPSHGDDSFTAPTFTSGTFSKGTLPSHAADSFTKPTFASGAFSAGTLPGKGSNTTVVTAVSAEDAST